MTSVKSTISAMLRCRGELKCGSLAHVDMHLQHQQSWQQQCSSRQYGSCNSVIISMMRAKLMIVVLTIVMLAIGETVRACALLFEFLKYCEDCCF